MDKKELRKLLSELMTEYQHEVTGKYGMNPGDLIYFLNFKDFYIWLTHNVIPERAKKLQHRKATLEEL